MKTLEQAESLINQFRIVLMNEDTDCGNEILCTEIARKNAIICVQNILNANPHSNPFDVNIQSTYDWWLEVKEELEIFV